MKKIGIVFFVLSLLYNGVIVIRLSSDLVGAYIDIKGIKTNVIDKYEDITKPKGGY